MGRQFAQYQTGAGRRRRWNPTQQRRLTPVAHARQERAMIQVRQVFQAQFGRGGQLAAAMAESSRTLSAALGGGHWRVLTDLTGPFDTVVLELEAGSLADWERIRAELFASPELAEAMASTAALIASGRNELYTLEAQG